MGMERLSASDMFHSGTSCTAYEIYGCHKNDGGGYIFRVWAPHAKDVVLVLNGADVCSMALMPDNESRECVCLQARAGDRYNYKIVTFEGRELLKAIPMPSEAICQILNVLSYTTFRQGTAGLKPRSFRTDP